LRARGALPTVSGRETAASPKPGPTLPLDPTLPLHLVPVWFTAGLVWWTLLEYLLHRFAFHGRVAGLGRRHLAHHADLQSRDLALASPPAVGLGLAGHAALFLGLLGPVPGGAALAGVTAGYAAYEAIHLAVHRPRPRSRLLRHLRRHHLLHHGARPHARFGVTTDLWDRVFGTLEPRPRRRRRPAGATRIPGLTRGQVRVLRAVAEALFAGPHGPPAPGRIEAALREVGLFAQRVGTQTRLAVRVALLVVQATPALFFLRIRRFTAVAPELRALCLERLERGRLGALAVVLKLSLCLAFFEQPETLEESGYTGPGLPRAPRGLPVVPAEERA
jgi:hypothetical protein